MRITIQDILLDLKERIERQRIDLVVIDPWNVLKQNRRHGQNKTDFLEEWLPIIEDFARVNNVHILIVAHPSKPERHRGVVQQMTMYDVEDSRHWADMISNIFIVNRTQEDKEGNENKVDIRIAKIKDGRYGKCGVHTLYYRPWSGNYEDSTR
jgi:twinkle protein